jgi:MYXO-CTERM domain-containing protein
MKTFTLGLTALAGALAALLAPQPAQACGGFFCSSTPVDQNAERVVFKIRDDGRTDMIVQISYQGKAEDFAWILPLAEPPKKEDLGVFPQRALTALDAQTGVVVSQSCARAANGGPFPAAGTVADDSEEHTVDVYVRTQIGNYEVAVIGSEDAQALADWLKDNDFRMSDAMLGFIKLYVAEGMKFLALKLLPEKTANDITPFKLTLAGESPSIPLRLSAVAAEPEMGIVVWVLGKSRYEPANAEELTIDNKLLRLDERYRSNWLPLVARAVDEAQGRGFVVEYAEALTNLRSLLMNSFTSATDQVDARNALSDLFANASYITRLYTRVSPEEMTFDPLFKRSSKGDVSRFRSVSNDDQCTQPAPGDPCDFTACGALGLCRLAEDAGQKAAGCACAGGSTARTTFVPDASGSFTPTVSCIDKRLSFLNPGERNAAGEALPDPCVGVDCGGHGKCVPMNMTPTCECDKGYVAQGLVASDGTRSAKCVMPTGSVPDAFYNRRALPRDSELPVGREETMPAPTGASDPDDPVPEGNMMAGGSGKLNKSSGSSCALGGQGESGGGALALGLVALFGLRRRRRVF